jgi:HPt (histidine-containing phosphotransfer) domain-containing protein
MSSTAGRPIDLDHLNRYTGGDRGLNAEILKLFEDQCATTLAQLEDLAKENGAGTKAWHLLTHTLKVRLAGWGRSGLPISRRKPKKTADRAAAIEILHRLKGTSSAVHVFVEELLNSPANPASNDRVI